MNTVWYNLDKFSDRSIFSFL